MFDYHKNCCIEERDGMYIQCDNIISFGGEGLN